MQLCDFDFLAWVERSMLFRDTFLATLTDKLGVTKEVADTLAFSGAIREHKGLIALFQDYCQEPGPEQDAFMAFVTYAQGLYKQTQDVTSFVFATETGLVIGKVAATSGQGWKFYPFTNVHQPSRKFWSDPRDAVPEWAKARGGTFMTKAEFNQKFPNNPLK